MKKLFTLATIAFLMGVVALGKETPVQGGVLNALYDAVQAADSGDVLILAAGEIYPNQGAIDITIDITIMGQGSIEEGNLPYIKELPAQDGSWAAQTLQVLNTFKLYNVFFNGFRGEEENNTNDRCIRVNSPIDTLIVDGCVFEQYRKRTIALNKAVDYVKCTNSIFNHNWKISGLDEGRGFDMRNGDHGTVILENCTFLNSSDRHIRHQKWGANKAPVVENLIINQCTFVNSGNYRPTFSFWSIGDLTFTNNLVVNHALFGTDTVSIRKEELPYLEGSDAVGAFGPMEVCPFTLTEVDSFNTVVTMSHNNLYQDPAITALFDAGPEVTMPQNFNNEFLEVINEDSVSFEEAVTFNIVPPPPTEMIQEYISITDTLSEPTQVAPTYNIVYYKYDTLDLGYSATSQSATAATDGGPLGDRRWMQPATSVNDRVSGATNNVLFQNYPNPFSEVTTVKFKLERSSHVNLTIYNLVGAQVRLLSSQEYPAGLHEIRVEKGNLKAGVYFLKLSARNEADIIKLTVK